jgi:CRP-like cAMP-binding protein
MRSTVSDEGTVFGELSILLDKEHSASVECLEDSKFYCIENPREYFEDHPKVIWHIAQILGLRIFNLNQYLADLKHQDEGQDHLQTRYARLLTENYQLLCETFLSRNYLLHLANSCYE